MRKVVLDQWNEYDGDDGIRWELSLDGVVLIEDLRNRDLELGDCALDPLWEALGVSLTFVEDES